MTKIFENQTELERPDIGQWVRIKNGLYQGDIGLVDFIKVDDNYYVKLIPRYDPQSLQKDYNKKDNKYPISHRFPQ